MKKNFKTLFLFSAFISFSLMSNSNAQGNINEGKKIYEQNCASCHGIKGKGDGTVGAALNPKPRNFVEAKFKYGSDDKSLYKTISNGKGIMPQWKGILSDKQINNVISYIKTFKGKK
ncbi:MAG: c-type cytochrome [Candidatus Sericytochromatia bacterium]